MHSPIQRFCFLVNSPVWLMHPLYFTPLFGGVCTCSVAVDLCSSSEVILHRPVKEKVEALMKDGGQKSAKN